MLDIKITAPEISEGWYQHPEPLRVAVGNHDVMDIKGDTIFAA